MSGVAGPGGGNWWGLGTSATVLLSDGPGRSGAGDPALDVETPAARAMTEAQAIRSLQLEQSNPAVFRTIGIVAGLQIVIGSLVVLSDATYPRSRLAVVCALGSLAVGTAFAEYRWKGPGRAALGSYFLPLAAVFCFIGMVGTLGGPGSPMSPLLFQPVLGRAIRYGTTKPSLATIGLALFSLGALLLLPDSWFGPELATPQAGLLWAVMLGGVLMNQFIQAGLVSDGFRQSGDKLDELREALLRDHAAHARGLETIGAKVAHELKNPLTSIKALLQLMAEDSHGPQAQKRFEVLNAEVARMQEILSDYLSFSRPLDELRTSQVELLGLSRQVRAVLEARASAAQVQIVVDGKKTSIMGDPQRLRGMLLNLLGNALEATPAGGTVGVTVRPDAGGAQLLVRDTGKGMDSATLERIGQPFFSTKRKGTGLGVVIASTTVRQHGGTIHYASTAGEGTTVTVELPANALPKSDPSKSYEKLSELDVQQILAREPAARDR
ncbi:MAG: HAMP domain-containing sensor histidine kinase [Myxococcota bacterium]